MLLAGAALIEAIRGNAHPLSGCGQHPSLRVRILLGNERPLLYNIRHLKLATTKISSIKAQPLNLVLLLLLFKVNDGLLDLGVRLHVATICNNLCDQVLFIVFFVWVDHQRLHLPRNMINFLVFAVLTSSVFQRLMS